MKLLVILFLIKSYQYQVISSLENFSVTNAQTHKRTNARTNERTNARTNERTRKANQRSSACALTNKSIII